MEVIATIIGLLGAVALLSLIARRVRLPYPAVMVVAGLCVSFVPHLPTFKLNPEYVMLLLVPPLLYDGAWQMPWRGFRDNIRPILMMAVGFVLFTSVSVAAAMHAVVPGMTWAAALTLGAVVSPTDPVAATAVLRRLGVPNRVSVILEGESLVNDATGLTLFRIAAGAAVALTFSPGSGAVEVLRMVGGGIGIGLACGWIVARVHRRLDDPLAEVIITLVSPFAAYLPAAAAGASGVLATVVTGLYVSRQAPHLLSPRVRQRAKAVWETLVFMLNGLIFVLIGLQFPYMLSHKAGETALRLTAYVAILVAVLAAARVAWVFPVSYLTRRLVRHEPPTPWRELVLISFTNMRGVISLAAVMSVPFATASGAAFPRRGLIIFLTFWVILSSLVLQSLSLPWLVRRLGLAGRGGPNSCDEWDARLRIARAGLERLEAIRAHSEHPREAVDRLADHYRWRVESLSRMIRDEGESCRDFDPAEQNLRHEVLGAERQKLLDLYDHDAVSDEILQQIETDLDLEEIRWGVG